MMQGSDNFYKNIGARIRMLREQEKLTRDVLAEKADISSQFLVHIENGSKGISAKTLFGLAKALNVTADYLLSGADNINDRELIIEALSSLSKSERIQTEKLLIMAARIVALEDK